MKKVINILFIAFAVTSLSVLQSCSDDNNGQNNMYANALVTVKPIDNGDQFYLQLDEATAIKPVNVTKSPYGNKQVRALINFEEATEQSVSSVYKPVILNWMDSIRTKEMVKNLGQLENMTTYGTDPVDVVRDWVTLVEDGYLTLRFRTFWGYTNIKHSINLVYGTNPNDPYEVVLYHDAHSDFRERVADGLVAFDLSKLPDTNGQTVNLTLRYFSLTFNCEKSIVFKYNSKGSSNKILGTNFATFKSEVNIE